MGKLGLNSGYIGSDQRTTTNGVVGYDKYYLERVNGRFFPVLEFVGLLDLYSGAAAAYSLRKLRFTYQGSAVRVRRSSDNTEQDIGFDSNGNLNTAALLAFCSGTNGFVTTWYDQSGNGRDATQSTGANQPQIVSNGGVVLDNGKATIAFDGGNDNMSSSNYFNNVGYGVIFGVHRQTSQELTEKTVIVERVESTGVTRAALSYRNPTAGNTGIGIGGRRISSNTFQAIGNQLWSSNQFLATSFFKWTEALLESYINGASNGTLNPFQTAGSTNTSTNGTVIGSGNSVNYFNGYISELIIYTSDQSTNRTGIESNINSFYNIY
jgi:hypothetical protein